MLSSGHPFCFLIRAMKPAPTTRSIAYFLILSALSATSYGLGFRIADQGAEATARGDAFAATADDPSAIYYNPAGITQLEGTRVLLGAYSISLKSRVSLDTPAENNHFSTVNTDPQTIPTFYATWKGKNSPVALGLGVYAPYGFAVEYPDDTPFRTVARKGSIEYLTLNPVLAWKITDTLSVAAGPTISYGKAELDRGIFAVGDNFQFRGDGMAYGFDAGIMWSPQEMHHFGLTYRSATRIDFDGHATVRTDPLTVPTAYGPFTIPGIRSRNSANAEFNLPQTLTFGYSFRPTKDWNLEADVDWTDWHSLKTVTLHQPSGDTALPFNWQSSFLCEFGVTKKFAHDFRASAGYCYSERSVPNDSFNPGIPDSTRHVFSVGFGQGYEHFNWNLAYQYTYGPARTIAQGTIADGTYRFDSHALTLSLGYNF